MTALQLATGLKPPNGWPLSCGRARCYHDSCRARPPARLKPAAVSFSGLLGGGLSLEARQPAPNNGSETISVQVVDALTAPLFDVDEPRTFELPKVASGRGPAALEAGCYLACGHGPAVEAQYEEYVSPRRVGKACEDRLDLLEFALCLPPNQ